MRLVISVVCAFLLTLAGVALAGTDLRLVEAAKNQNKKAVQALLQMTKFDISTLKKAYEVNEALRV